MDNNSKVVIQFLGAAGTVTGSKYRISALGKSILVDCGLFQGVKKLRELNWSHLPVNGSEIDLVLLTHGHLDHVGYLPRFVKSGFRGRILGTGPTLEITKIILEDSARIQEEDAEQANREGYSRHKPALPLYDLKDVQQTTPLFESHPLDQWTELYEGISFRYRYNGHILGATFIEMKIGGKTFVFSGDIGREEDSLMFPPKKPESADVLLMESTYGNRLHRKNAVEEITRIITEAAQKNGTVIIPSFAVERTQLLMYILWQLRLKGAIPPVPVYLDSPMGKNITDLFSHNLEWHKLSAGDCRQMCSDFIFIRTVEETLDLARKKSSKIVIAGSGMGSGGRVLTYFQYHIGNPDTTVLLVGYQAEGTRGRSLLDGEKQIKIRGKFFPVEAAILNINGLSAHADQGELIRWLSELKKKPQSIFLVHGEKEGAEGLRKKIKETYGWECNIPELYQQAEIEI
jgi:metallo-beta-lactamase family protein